MKIFTREEVFASMKLDIDRQHFNHDNDGQVVIYTGIFEWRDGTYRDEPEGE